MEDPLEPLELPLKNVWLPRLSSLLSVVPAPSAALGGVDCDVLTGTTRPDAQLWLGIPESHLILWLGKTDHRLRQIRVVVPAAKWAVTVAIRSLRETPSGKTPRWQAPVSPTNRVELVTLPRLRGAMPEALRELGVLQWVAP